MIEVIYFAFTFIVIFLLYCLFILRSKKALEKFKTSTEVAYLTKRYQINVDKIGIKKLARTVALSNAFLISLIVFLVSVIDNFLIMFIVAILIMIPFILGIYHLIGIHYKKKETK